MSVKKISERLRETLLYDKAMDPGLYEYELEEQVPDLIQSLKSDNNDFLFIVTENSGHIAMVLIDKDEKVYINELALDYIKNAWPNTYRSNLKGLIPDFARQLNAGVFPINGITIEKNANAGKKL